MTDYTLLPAFGVLTGAEGLVLEIGGAPHRGTLLDAMQKTTALNQPFTFGGGVSFAGAVALGDASGDVVTMNAANLSAPNGVTITGGAWLFPSNVSIGGNATLGDAAGDQVVCNAATMSIPNGLAVSGGLFSVTNTSATVNTLNGTAANGLLQRFSTSGTARGYVGAGAAVFAGATLSDFGLASEGGLLFGGPAGVVNGRIAPNGDITLGPSLPTTGYHRIGRNTADENNVFMDFYNVQGTYSAAYWQLGAGPYGSSANTVLTMRRNSVTSRSINAGGTVNANGADYAEYVRKHAMCGTILKGQICGIDAHRQLVTTFADMVRPAIKSTDPSYVGGDRWKGAPGRDDLPPEPVLAVPEFEGPPHPGELPPFALVEPTPPIPANIPEPEEPVRGEREGMVAFAKRVNAWVSAHARYVQAAMADQQAAADYDTRRRAFCRQRKAYRAMEEAHAAQLAAHEAAMEAYRPLLAQAEADHAAALAQHSIDLADFKAQLEAAQQHYDRVTWSGQVPAIVAGEVVAGDYVIAEDDGAGGIIGVCVAEPTPAQLKRKVGFVMVAYPTEEQLRELIDASIPINPAWTAIVDVGRG